MLSNTTNRATTIFTKHSHGTFPNKSNDDCWASMVFKELGKFSFPASVSKNRRRGACHCQKSGTILLSAIGSERSQ